MSVIADAPPLIYLAAIGPFHLLQALYTRLIVPRAVYDEVVTQGGGRWGATETAAATWIDCQMVNVPGTAAARLSHLHHGETEVICLAEQLPADLVIMDEFAGRTELAKGSIPFIGTVGVLIQAKVRGLIAALRPELDNLRACGFHLSDRLYQGCLAGVGE